MSRVTSSKARRPRWVTRRAVLVAFVLGDVLGGSIGNDTITSNSTTQPDYIVTAGRFRHDQFGRWPQRCGSRRVLRCQRKR